MTKEKHTLFERLLAAKQLLQPHHTDYRVAYEENIDEPMKVLVPSPNWMACAIHGYILPPVESYHNLEFGCWIKTKYDHTTKDEKEAQDWCQENQGFYEITNSHFLHDYTIGSMTEEEAIVYLIKKDVPRKVWDKETYPSNKQQFYIVKADQIPTDRTKRNSWRFTDLCLTNQTV